jgi:proton glutamate symport protein
LSSWTVVAGMVLGIVIGLYDKNLGARLAPAGNLYLAFLQMCVMPIMLGAITSSLGHMLRSQSSNRLLSRMGSMFLVGLLTSSAIGIGIGLVGGIGSGMDNQARATLGRMLTASESGQDSTFAVESEISISGAEERPAKGLGEFFVELVPANVFAALSEGRTLKILFFSIIFGLATAFIPPPLSDNILAFFSAIFKAFEKVTEWAMYGLPFGLCCLIADQMSRIGSQIILAMIRLISAVYFASFLLCLISAVILWIATRGSFLKPFKALYETLIIGFGTRSSLAAMPAALRGLHEGFDFDQEQVNLIVPLGITLCRYSTVMNFTLAAIFFSQFYGIPIGLQQCLIILMGAVLAAMASAGAPGLVTVTMIAILFEPLGLPIGPAIVLLLAIDPITDPIQTVTNLHTNCAMAALVIKPPWAVRERVQSTPAI